MSGANGIGDRHRFHGAFKSLQVGQTISFDNTAGGTNNNGIYTVTAVSPDGNSITLDQNVNAGRRAVVDNNANLNLAGAQVGPPWP